MGELFRPVLLARVMLVVAAVVATTIACGVAIRTRGVEARPLGDPRRIADERALELGSAALAFALVAEVLAALVGVVGAAAIHPEIRGAMCAYGVLTSTPTGVRSLATSIAAALASAAGLGLVRLDAQLDDLRLVRARSVATLALAPVVGIDAFTTWRFVAELDFGVVATCCSSGAEIASTAAAPSHGTSPAFVAALAVSAGTAALVRRAGTRLLGASAAIGLLPLTFVAAAEVSAPHVFGVANHRCAYCLLEAEGYRLGYPLFALSFGAAALGAAVVAVRSGRAHAASEADALERKWSRGVAVLAVATALALALPVALHRARAGAFVVTPY